MVTTQLSTRARQAALRTLGARVRERRLELGVSQERLGELSGLHRTYVGGVERGERNVSLINIVVLARALDLDPAHLVEGLGT